MHRRLAPWFGGLVLVLVAGFLAVFGRQAVADPATVALLSGLVVAAVLSIAGGRVESITVGSRTLPWNVLLGTADVVLALTLVPTGVRTVRTGGTDAWLVAAALVVGAASLGWFGLQTARDTRHVDLEASPSRSRVVGIAVLVVVSIGVGVLVATLV